MLRSFSFVRRDEYESLKSSKDVAEEESIFAFKARKSLTAQRRQIKEQSVRRRQIMWDTV